MKKWLVAAMLIAGMASFAQDKVEKSRLTPEQRSELQVKKLTLDLGLNEQQKKELKTIFVEQNTKRDAAMQQRRAMKDKNEKLSADERFKLQGQILDQQIAMKERVKKVLTPEQFAKWESSRDKKRMAVGKHMKDRKSGHKVEKDKK